MGIWIFVAALLTSDPSAPTASVLDLMLSGEIDYVLSVELLAEYREVLLRERIRTMHALTEAEVDEILTTIAANGIIREPAKGEPAPDQGDQHLWSLMAGVPSSVLVTGDRRLLQNPPRGRSVISPASFISGLSPQE